WYCCGEASLSMAVSPFFALTLLDQSPGPRARTLSAVWIFAFWLFAALVPFMKACLSLKAYSTYFIYYTDFTYNTY
ncbi:hypothetical protein LXE05_20490, partial [Yersinia enterocolitica]|nr:hypothetical protein [Yersinia enterocolitica]MCF3931676.1 hypothetical protein [Yersinia enterocolitica]